MNTFSINKAALTEILNIICLCETDDPVVMLQDVANPQDLLDDVTAAILAGTDHKDLIELERERFEGIEDQLSFYLDVATYEKQDCQPEDLIEVNGVMFVMADYIFEALRNYCLMFDGDHFILKSADDTARNLQSIIETWCRSQTR